MSKVQKPDEISTNLVRFVDYLDRISTKLNRFSANPVKFITKPDEISAYFIKFSAYLDEISANFDEIISKIVRFVDQLDLIVN